MSLRIPSLTLAASLLCAAVSPAEDSAPGAELPAYDLKKKSAFTPMADDQRAPFWPIGWVKHKAGQVAEVQAAPAAPAIVVDDKSFKVTSILLGNPSFAIINGRTYSEGEFLRQPRASGGAATVATSPIPAGARIRVFRINDGAVILQHQAQLITATLQRPELSVRTGDEELLSEDRP